jgi:heterotetrameric sarcosine oxidase gamma subunit
MAVLREVELASQVSVRGEPQTGFPVEPNTTAGDVLWLGPDEWLVLGGHEDDYPDAAAAVDVSANRVCFELAGEDVEDVLAQGCSLDLHSSVFPPGRCSQTLLARAQVILHRTYPERFRIFVRPSYAPYLRVWLEDALTSPRSSLRRR